MNSSTARLSRVPVLVLAIVARALGSSAAPSLAESAFTSGTCFPHRSYLVVPAVETLVASVQKQHAGRRRSWIDEDARAELPSQHSRQLAMIAPPSTLDSTSFVSPETSAPPACCPNAPLKKIKSMRRRPDDENESTANSELPLARKLSF
jgi:hypothetical protein